ncbi:tyrosine-type recombinase/integrase [Streptomyces sp. NPDC032472]|uniref:tyrosine-type recombinase/integrase n=1 Tax=Streptomyces sp. NPDC032472 TaxID=3155018 RepID=UPI0033C87A76
MSFAVQRLRLTDDGPLSYTVVGGDGLPVAAVEDFLAYLAATGASPNTVQGYAYDLRDFFVWLEQVRLDFRRVRLEVLAQFFEWLRRPKPARAAGVFVLPDVGQALENTTLQRKRAALASFYRFHARRDERVPALLGNLLARQPTGRFVPMLAHTRRGGEVEHSPIRIPAHRKPPKTLSNDEVQRLMTACNRRRDRFLIALLDDSGLRISEALGLRHADLNLRRGEIHVVPRENNANHARVKGMKGRTVPVSPELFDRYATYMETEYGALDCDFVFANLFRAPIGSPMTRANVNELVERLQKRTGIAHFSPHACRHTYATRLLRAKVPIEVVAELLGHSSSQTTAEVYSHLDVEDHRRVLLSAGIIKDGVPDQ